MNILSSSSMKIRLEVSSYARYVLTQVLIHSSSPLTPDMLSRKLSTILLPMELSVMSGSPITPEKNFFSFFPFVVPGTPEAVEVVERWLYELFSSDPQFVISQAGYVCYPCLPSLLLASYGTTFTDGTLSPQLSHWVTNNLPRSPFHQSFFFPMFTPQEITSASAHSFSFSTLSEALAGRLKQQSSSPYALQWRHSVAMLLSSVGQSFPFSEREYNSSADIQRCLSSPREIALQRLPWMFIPTSTSELNLPTPVADTETEKELLELPIPRFEGWNAHLPPPIKDIFSPLERWRLLAYGAKWTSLLGETVSPKYIHRIVDINQQLLEPLSHCITPIPLPYATLCIMLKWDSNPWGEVFPSLWYFLWLYGSSEAILIAWKRQYAKGIIAKKANHMLFDVGSFENIESVVLWCAIRISFCDKIGKNIPRLITFGSAKPFLSNYSRTNLVREGDVMNRMGVEEHPFHLPSTWWHRTATDPVLTSGLWMLPICGYIFYRYMLPILQVLHQQIKKSCDSSSCGEKNQSTWKIPIQSFTDAILWSNELGSDIAIELAVFYLSFFPEEVDVQQALIPVSDNHDTAPAKSFSQNQLFIRLKRLS